MSPNPPALVTHWPSPQPHGLAAALWLALAAFAAACTSDDANVSSTAFVGGRVVLAGPDVVLRQATVIADQVEYLAGPPVVVIREHVQNAQTDDHGHFLIDGRQLSGQYRLTFRGGEFTNPGTGQVVRLDPTDELVTYVDVPIGTRRDDHLISLASVITARVAEERFANGADERFGVSLDWARPHVDAYLGDVAWEYVEPADLTRRAASPTEAVRAAWLLGAVDLVARDMAASARASASEVNVHRLLQAWSLDLAAADTPTFDGNDHDARGGGLRLGSECPAPDAGCVEPPGCATGACLPPCELYSGSARVKLAEALLTYAHQVAPTTGLPDSDALATARALEAIDDPVLFKAGTCIEDLDRLGPRITFELPEATTTDVAGMLTVRVVADDALDDAPRVWLERDNATLPDADGDSDNDHATATLDTGTAGTTLTITARAVDVAGNETMLAKTWTVDNDAPLLTVDPAGFFDDGQSWWIRPIGMPLVVPTGPHLTATVVDAHLRDLRARIAGTDIATATVSGDTWDLALPDGTVAGLAPVSVEIIARDHAGNTTSLIRVLRRDDRPPVLTMLGTSVRDESSDVVTLTPHSVGNVVDDIAITHNHGGAKVALGAATACDAAAPTVHKYGYLLDDARPPYVLEIDPDPAEDSPNPVRWAFALVDDGVGVDPSTVQYSVRDVDASVVLLDWTAAPTNGSGYEVKLYRSAGGGSAIPAVGRDGRFEIAMRGRDRLGREVQTARCWNHHVLPAPLLFDAAGVATTGPTGAGKFALRDLSLASTSYPIGALVLNDGAGGTGLMEYVVWNPASEAVFLTIDLTKPTGGTYAKTYTKDRWAFSDVATNISCGNDPDIYDSSLPGCERVTANPGPGNTVLFSASGGTNPVWGVRIWEELGPLSYVELAPCAGCSSTSPIGNQVRVTVRLPPRAPPVGGQSVAPRKFRVMAVAKTVVELRPEGASPYTEFTAGGVQLTGQIQQQSTGCTHYQRIGITWRCTNRRTYTQYRALVAATFAVVNNRIETFVRASLDGLDPARPPYLSAAAADQRTANVAPWSTTEPSPPFPPPSP